LAAPGVKVFKVGALGSAAGVTALEEVDQELVPIALVALSRNTYAVPLVKPVTVSEVALDAREDDQLVQVEPESLE
jgi:molybdate-binding protein